MSVGNQPSQVQPGPCPIDPVTGLPQCPQPTEIDVIRVTRVFCECYDIQNEEIEIPFEAPTLEVITGDAQEAECVSTEATLINCLSIGNDLVQLVYSLRVTARVPLDEGGFEFGTAVKTVTKVITLACNGTGGVDVALINPECFIYSICQGAVISERDDIGNVTQVTAQVQVINLVRKVAPVQMCIPSYGLCPPQQCG